MMILRVVGTVLGALLLAPLAAITTLLCTALRPPDRRPRQRRPTPQPTKSQNQIFCVGADLGSSGDVGDERDRTETV